MKKKNLLIMLSSLICIALLMCFTYENKITNENKYILKAGTLVEIGKDIPEGTYELNLNKDDNIGYASLSSKSNKLEVIDLVKFRVKAGYKGYRKFRKGEKLDLTNTESDIVIIKQ